ncbi:hypothetical protein [Streptomyces sp. V1I6]|uniref:hypothetical protein n=1 Tax=Streptomyces sp. V1I6 TaxID=3042273 RepID=UPI002780A014|nr:hypothetical protein [Streptomyces sp. V1I6]MDQ0844611.1 hypothetical protein [Streptomyces sp. V1I6]
MAMVTFVDETTSGDRRDALGLPVAEERLALRELIRRRVFQETAEGAQEAYERALAAFGSNGFLVLVGERQLTDLDERVDITASTEVTFLRLVPLVGG